MDYIIQLEKNKFFKAEVNGEIKTSDNKELAKTFKYKNWAKITIKGLRKQNFYPKAKVVPKN